MTVELLAIDLMLNETQAKAATNDSGSAEVMNEEMKACPAYLVP
jgi:hypothetical protein